MRILSKLILTSLLLTVPATMVACDDSGDDDGGAGSDGDGDTGGTGAGGNDGTGNSPGSGAGNGVGGEAPIDCGDTGNQLFLLDHCLAAGGPDACVTGVDTAGAFVDGDWLAGWTNWSTNSTPEDTGAEPDGAIEDCTTGTCTYEEGVYTLDANVYVQDGATIVFEPGVIVRGGGNNSLIVKRGGKIQAVGTVEKPIIFTSKAANGAKAPGNWGGIILLGKAVNAQGDAVYIEGLDPETEDFHGGNDNADNSGELKYVRLEFGGFEIGDGNEINGLTLGSVGSGTKISYVQVNGNLDDGFEFFGGAVSADHLVSNNAGDDMFDADDGYQGTLSFLFGRQVVADSDNPNGFEIDGTADLGEALVNDVDTELNAENATICGLGGGGLKLAYGGVLREGGLTGSFDSVVTAGFDVAFDPRDDFGTNAAPAMTITNSWSFEQYDEAAGYEETVGGTEPFLDDDAEFDEQAWFVDESTNTDVDSE